MCWTEVGERCGVETDLISETVEQVNVLKDRLKEAHDRQKSYADQRRKHLEFTVGDEVYLKMRTFRGNDPNRKLKKLKPRYMGPFVITERIGAVAYRLVLPPEMADFHDVFHVSVLRKMVREPELILSQPPWDAQPNLTLNSTPIRIVDQKEIEVRGKKVRMVLVRWERDGIPEEVWERESQFLKAYPGMSQERGNQVDTQQNSGTNSFLVGENCNTPAQAQVEKAQQRETLSNPNPETYIKRSLPTAEPSDTHQAKPCEIREPPPPPAHRGSAAADHHPRSPSRRSRVPSRRLLDSVACNRLRLDY